MSAADCQRLRPYLLDFVVGELDPAEAHRLELEKHLAGCTACRAAVEELRGTGRALEAVKVFDSQLNEQVRRDISRQAHVEAEKVRQARERGRARAGLVRPVPVHAWLILVLGTALALAALAAVPPWLRSARADAGHARVLGALGAEFGPTLAPGSAIELPEGAMLYLRLADGSHLKVRGPAEAALAGGGAPLKLKRGAAWLAAGKAPVLVGLEPLGRLQLEAEAQAALEARPADAEAALVAVLAGVASYAAPGGEDGQVTQGQTLAVKAGGAPAVRTSKESEKAPWHKSFPRGPDGERPGP